MTIRLDKQRKLILALAMAIVETVEESPEGWAPEGIVYAGMLPAMPSMTSAEFQGLVDVACATGRIRRAGAHVLRKVVTACADCGAEGERTGHQECPYPKDHP